MENRKPLKRSEEKFLDEIKKDARDYMDLLNDVYVQKTIKNGQMEFIEKTIDSIVRDISDFVERRGISDDVLILSDMSLLEDSCEVVGIMYRLNSLATEDIDLTRINIGTLSFFSKFDRLIGGNKELKNSLSTLGNLIGFENSPAAKAEDIDMEDMGKAEISDLINNIKVLNKEVRFLIDEISQLKAERKSSPSLSQHFLASIKRELK
jgi:hypothetical protein